MGGEQSKAWMSDAEKMMMCCQHDQEETMASIRKKPAPVYGKVLPGKMGSGPDRLLHSSAKGLVELKHNATPNSQARRKSDLGQLGQSGQRSRSTSPLKGQGSRRHSMDTGGAWSASGFFQASGPVLDHPHLTKYFKTIETNLKHMKHSIAEGERSRLIHELKKLAAQSFKHHDGSGDGCLDKEESQTFFQHYVKCLMKFIKHQETLKINQVLQWESEKRKSNLGDEKRVHDMAKSITKNKQVTRLANLQMQMDDELAAYEKDKDTRHTQAFAVIDKDGDGCLEEQEVIDALTPGHPTYLAFHSTLSLSIDRYF